MLLPYRTRIRQPLYHNLTTQYQTRRVSIHYPYDASITSPPPRIFRYLQAKGKQLKLLSLSNSSCGRFSCVRRARGSLRAALCVREAGELWAPTEQDWARAQKNWVGWALRCRHERLRHVPTVTGWVGDCATDMEDCEQCPL